MKKFFVFVFIIGLFAGICAAQQKTAARRVVAKPSAAVKTNAPQVDTGLVLTRTYTNKSFGFEVTFPATWSIASRNFESYAKKNGYDLTLKAPSQLSAKDQMEMNRQMKDVTLLLTAFRSMNGFSDNAIIRISVEDLKSKPLIKDAVDYFDAMRQTYLSIKLPADFNYSETQAEQLGHKQFAFLNTSGKAGNKRMYATVRNGFALVFTLSYSNYNDLETMRQILSEGNFALK